MSIEKDAMGNVTGMWLGAKDPDKPEYMAPFGAYHRWFHYRSYRANEKSNG